MLLDNCTVVTMDAERRILRDAAIVIQGNSIAAVGKSSEIRPRFPEEPVRDLHGWVVTPGLGTGTLCALDRNGRVRWKRTVARSSHDACIVTLS